MAMRTKPEILIVHLKKNKEYTLELDTMRSSCDLEVAHWHLRKDGKELGSIAANQKWLVRPEDVDPAILAEVMEITKKHSVQICWAYSNNAMHGY